MNAPETATVRVLEEEPAVVGMRWVPMTGDQANGVLRRAPIDEHSRRQTLESAWEILGRGIDPQEESGEEAGLVVGYVQSGKTLSFTTVIGLARDNKFPLVIVIAGTKTNLLSQSTERLAGDLGVADGPTREWRLLPNPTGDHLQTIKKVIEDWSDPELDEDERVTLLITVLKQQDRLGQLTSMLREIDLTGIPVLVIDDEADQAGLNTQVRKGSESTIYRCLRELRSALPLHTYLLYTATPQAPLLINIASALAPSFVHVLEPGEGYVGGAEFFRAGSPYAKVIPAAEVLDEANLPAEPPSSLVDALRFFFVGLAATLAARQPGEPPKRRSMMVHPSRIRDVHRLLKRWIDDCVTDWSNILADENDPDRADLIGDFRSAWEDARQTTSDIPDFESVMAKMKRALRRTQVIEFNTNGRVKTPEIEWRDADGWILVGGQALDRGYTVDSLTVTYMPRGVGTGNADAIQQRARFFGYKRDYLGLCRVYLERATLKAFQDYVEHEEIMRAELEKVAASNTSLREWTRRFVLSRDLKPCRTSIISVGEDYVRGRAGGGWTQQREAKLTDDLRDGNAAVVAKLIDGLSFRPDDTYQARSSAQQHQVAQNVPLSSVAEFLAEYSLPDTGDTAAMTAVYVAIGQALDDNPQATADVYLMRPDGDGRRTVDDDGFLKDGFLQGRTGDGRDAYPGDAFFRASDRVSVQLHAYDLYQGEGTTSVLVAARAPLIAVHVPANLALPTVVQTPAPITA